VDFSGFTPFFSPVMFFLDENLWPTMTLILVMVGWRQGPSGQWKELDRRTP
jgi:hypothetical protein